MALRAMIQGQSLRVPTAAITSCVCLFALWAGTLGGPAQDAPSILKLSIVDATTKQRMPARVEVLDKDGRAFVPEGALLIGGDCNDRDVAWQGTTEDALA